MKRIGLAALLAACLAGSAYAVGGTVPGKVYEVGVSSISTVIVTVSTNTAVNVDSPMMTGRVALEIDNMDASANLWCLPISTAPVTTGGRKITPGGTWSINISDRFYVPTDPTKLLSATTNKFWCISDGGAATKAAVTQLY